jgi:hypothetical protein
MCGEKGWRTLLYFKVWNGEEMNYIRKQWGHCVAFRETEVRQAIETATYYRSPS